MSKARILVQLDSDPQPACSTASSRSMPMSTSFFATAAFKAARCEIWFTVRCLRGASRIWDRPPCSSAVPTWRPAKHCSADQEYLLRADAGFGMLDSNGANYYRCRGRAVGRAASNVEGAHALVLAATGPVGSRVVRLLALEGARVQAASRSLRSCGGRLPGYQGTSP